MRLRRKKKSTNRLLYYDWLICLIPIFMAKSISPSPVFLTSLLLKCQSQVNISKTSCLCHLLEMTYYRLCLIQKLIVVIPRKCQPESGQFEEFSLFAAIGGWYDICGEVHRYTVWPSLLNRLCQMTK